MSDVVDEAQQLEEEWRKEALCHQRRVSVYGPGSATCKSCGEKIAAARRKVAPQARCCTSCQEQAEQRQK